MPQPKPQPKASHTPARMGPVQAAWAAVARDQEHVKQLADKWERGEVSELALDLAIRACQRQAQTAQELEAKAAGRPLHPAPPVEQRDHYPKPDWVARAEQERSKQTQPATRRAAPQRTAPQQPVQRSQKTMPQPTAKKTRTIAELRVKAKEIERKLAERRQKRLAAIERTLQEHALSAR